MSILVFLNQEEKKQTICFRCRSCGDRVRMETGIEYKLTDDRCENCKGGGEMKKKSKESKCYSCRWLIEYKYFGEPEIRGVCIYPSLKSVSTNGIEKCNLYSKKESLQSAIHTPTGRKADTI